LFLSDFYPPVKGGGYAQLCQEVAQQLISRGHQIWVLTSKDRTGLRAQEIEVFRLLHLENALDYYRPFQFLLYWKRRYRENLASLREVVGRVNPDVLLIWNLRRLPKALAGVAEGWEIPPTAYYLAGYWPVAENIHEAYWLAPARHASLRFLKRLLGRIALRQLDSVGPAEPHFRHTMCVSEGLKGALIREGLPVESARVVHNGIDPSQFSFKMQAEESDQQAPFSLIYAGQMVPQKGVHTAIEALDHLIHTRAIQNIHLTLLGSGHPDYEARLRNLVAERDLRDFIEFLPPVPREEMPLILGQFDAMLLPSIYEEPLARSIQEAMACGLVVLATLTGGTREIVVEGENGLGFAAGDGRALAEQLERLLLDPALRARLAKAGRQTVVERFDILRAVDEIESYLCELVARRPTTSPSAVMS
jgi:glycosyltransferase involved in cell wall biosynthesis